MFKYIFWSDGTYSTQVGTEEEGKGTREKDIVSEEFKDHGHLNSSSTNALVETYTCSSSTHIEKDSSY